MEIHYGIQFVDLPTRVALAESQIQGNTLCHEDAKFSNTIFLLADLQIVQSLLGQTWPYDKDLLLALSPLTSSIPWRLSEHWQLYHIFTTHPGKKMIPG